MQVIILSKNFILRYWKEHCKTFIIKRGRSYTVKPLACMPWLPSAYFSNSNSYHLPLHSLNCSYSVILSVSQTSKVILISRPLQLLVMLFPQISAWLASFYHLSVSSLRTERRLPPAIFFLLVTILLPNIVFPTL